MRKTKTFFLTCCLSLLGIVGYAQPPVTVLDGAMLPATQGWTEQKLDNTINPIAASTSVSNVANALKLTSTNAADQFSQLAWYQTGLDFNLGTGFTLEIKAKVIAADKTGAFNIQGYDKTGKGFRIGILTNAITELTDPFAATRVLATGLTNGDDFHIYKFAFATSGIVAVYRDGSLLGTFPLATFQFDNIIENGGFEDEEFPDFSSNGILTRVTDPKKVRYGNYALEMNSDGKVTDGWTDIEGARTRPIPIKPGGEYEIYITRRRTNGDPWAWRDMGVFYNDQDGVFNGADNRNPNITWGGANDDWWQIHPNTFTNTDNKQTVRFEFPSWRRDGNQTNIASFDNVTFREKLALTTGSAPEIAHGFPEPLFPEGYVNLIANGGFEDVTLNNDNTPYEWAQSDPERVTSNEPALYNPVWGGLVRIQTFNKTDDNVQGDYKHGGNNALRWTTLENWNNKLDFQVTLEPNKTYRFNFWYALPTWGEQGWLVLKTADETGAGTQIWGQKILPGWQHWIGWQNADVVFSTNDDETILHLYDASRNSNWWNLHFDDFVLYEVTPEQPIDQQIVGKTNLLANGDFEDVTKNNDGTNYVWALASDNPDSNVDFPMNYNEMWGTWLRLQDKEKKEVDGGNDGQAWNGNERFDTGKQWAHSGTRSLRFTSEWSAGAEAAFLNLNFHKELEPNKTYTFVFWLKMSCWNDKNGGMVIANGDLRLWQQDLSNRWMNWTRQSITFSTTADNHTLRLFTEFGGWMNGYLDDLFLYEEDTYVPVDDVTGDTYLAFGKSTGTSGTDVEIEYIKIDNTGSGIQTAVFNSNGGSTIEPQIVTGTLTAPEAPVKDGYDFAGWYSDLALTTAYDFATPVTTDIALYAKWTVKSYTLTFDSKGGSEVAPQTLEYNLKAEAPEAPEKTDYNFAGWFTDEELTAAYDFNAPVTANLTLYAKWMAPAIYYIDFGQDGGDSDAERQPTHGADVNGNYWNNVIAPYGQATTINAGTTVNLVNSHNEATNGVITLVNKASSNGGNTNCGLPDPNPELLGDLAIGTATNDYLFLDDGIGNQGHFRFSGLYAEKAYKFYIFGTRKTDDVRGGTFYIHGQNQFNDYLQNSGADIGTEITNTNDNTILVSTPVVPNEDGTIDFEFFIATPQSRFVYINALKIEEVDVPEELAVAKKFYIDFGKNNETQGNPVTSPDANGNYWNNVYSNGNDATRGASDGTDNLTLVTSDNKTTLYELELANNNVEFNGNGGLTNPDAALLGDLAIADATRDYVFTNNDGDIVLNFKKLNTAKTYRFNVFGSRNEADGRMGIITLTGENTFTGAHQTTGKHIGGTGINGNNRVIFVSDTITPTAEGLITLSMKQKFGMAYINAIKVEEITNTFIVTFNSNGGTAVASQEVFKNTAATEPDAPEPATPELEGHVLAGWYLDEALTIAYDFDTPLTADITLYAKWEIAVYTVTYHTNGSDNIADATYTIESEDLTLPVPTRTGYTFRGWFDNSEFTGEAVTGIPAGSTGDKAFYAKWEANVYAIVYHLNDGVGAEDATYTIESATITLPVPTKEGYDFSGWYANERFAGAVFTEIPQGSTGKKEFWAKWEEEANGIDELNVNLQLYPNPVVNGKLTINNILSNNGKVELYNVLGSLAGIYEITGNTTVIDISALPAGTYFVKINGQIAKILKK